jgi:phosphoserine aminotransferase
MSERIHNFSAGPAALPLSVLERAREELIVYDGSGMSIMEMSHRSKDFVAVMDNAEAGLRRIMGIPDNYEVLFLQGGASLQFSMVPMNLYLQGNPVDVINTGAWTQKAMVEIVPDPNRIRLDENASYVYLCSNNTIFGTQWRDFPQTGEIPLVADMSSDVLSRDIDVARFGLIFAGAQKNIGPAGVTIVIMQPELAERAPRTLPTMLQYRTHIKSRSRYNTPPTFGIYMISLVLDWIEAAGGLAAIEQRNDTQAQLLYDAIDNTKFYNCPVATNDRSRMNVVFRIRNGNEPLEQQFIEEATSAGLSGLKGHRSVGGLRASLYNAQTFEAVNALVEFMREFETKNG